MSKGFFVTARSHIVDRFSWRRLASAIILILSVSFLVYKTYMSWDALKTYDWQIQYQYLIPSFLLFLCQIVIISWGWQSIMNSLTQPLPFREHLKIYTYTNLMRRIPAGALWLLAGRMYAYRGQRVSARTSALASFLEFVLVILTGLPLAALAGSGLELLSPRAGILLAAIALVLEIGLIHPTVLGRLFRLVRHETLPAELTWRNTLMWALIYTLIWLISGTGLFLIICMFTEIPVAALPVTIGVWVLSSLIAYLTLLSPSGLGVKELSLTFLLGIYLPDPLPLVIALATRLIWTVYDIMVGVVAWAAQ
jgi:uncharacterized membrane protein YbhN (UPF0104 family)